MSRKCKHKQTVAVESSAGAKETICRECGAIAGYERCDETGVPRAEYDGFGVDLETHLAFMAFDNKFYPEGAYLTLLDEPLPSTAPGSECQGYRLKGPRYVTVGTDERPRVFVQRFDGGKWGRFAAKPGESGWYVSAHKTRLDALRAWP